MLVDNGGEKVEREEKGKTAKNKFFSYLQLLFVDFSPIEFFS